MKNKELIIIGTLLLLLGLLIGTVFAYESPEDVATKAKNSAITYQWHLHDTAEGIRSEINIHQSRIDKLLVEEKETKAEYARQEGIIKGVDLMLEAFQQQK